MASLARQLGVAWATVWTQVAAVVSRGPCLSSTRWLLDRVRMVSPLLGACLVCCSAVLLCGDHPESEEGCCCGSE